MAQDIVLIGRTTQDFVPENGNTQNLVILYK